MRIVAFIRPTSVSDQILTHLRIRAACTAHIGPGVRPRRGPQRVRGRRAPRASLPSRRRSTEAAPPPPASTRWRSTHPVVPPLRPIRSRWARSVCELARRPPVARRSSGAHEP